MKFVPSKTGLILLLLLQLFYELAGLLLAGCLIVIWYEAQETQQIEIAVSLIANCSLSVLRRCCCCCCCGCVLFFNNTDDEFDVSLQTSEKRSLLL